MRLDKEIEMSGYFWLPKDPSSKLPGTLRIDESGSASLEVLGLFGHTPEESFYAVLHDESASFERILGLVEGGPVTLERCWSRHKFGSLSVQKSHFNVGVAIVGCGYEIEEEIRFDRATIAIDGLEEWLGNDPFSWELNPADNKATIHYKAPSPVHLELPDLDASFLYAWRVPSTTKLEAKISHSAALSLATASFWTPTDLFQVSHQLANFITFAIDAPASLKSMTAYSGDVAIDIGGGKMKPVPQQIYYQSLPRGDTLKPVTTDQMLFRFSDLEPCLQPVLSAWMTNYSLLSPSISLFLSVKSGAHRFAESRFLALAQATETFHRRTSGETLMEEAEFQSLIEVVSKGCPPERAKWLAGRLAHGNEIPLRTRLKRLMKPFNALFGTEVARASLINRICATRNYLTHYDPKSASEAASGAALVAIAMKLDCLMQLELLRFLGVPLAKIEELAQREAFQQRLNPPWSATA